ncbi:MAG: hypothetical protein ACOX1F_05350 [Erysipelotrichaceae bacterium]|jgi:hypothetical protein
MKKIVLILLSILFSISLLTVSAANDSAVMIINGSTSTICDGLAFVEVNANSQEGVKNIKGQINYDKSVLAVFDVIVSDNLNGWDFKVNTSKAGTISFTGTAKTNDPITSDRLLFTVTFIVHGSLETTTVVSSKAVTSEIIEVETVNTGVIINQDEIDAATVAHESDESVIIPDPIFETKDIENKRIITFENASHSIRVVKAISKNCYLKNIEIENGTLSPVFNKLTNAYKVTIDEKSELKINYTQEDEKSTVVIQDEINNQVIITVTSENGNNNSYVLTIIRQANYNNTNVDPNIDDPYIPSDPNVDDNNNNPFASIDNRRMIIIIALAAVSLVGITIGGTLIYKGSRE